MPRHLPLVLLSASLLLCLGCGANQAKLRNDLKATGLAYHSYCDEFKLGPPGWDEFLAHARKNNLFPDGIERVRAAKYELTWKADLRAHASTASVVLGKPPTPGGPQLMLDGSVK